MATLLLVHAHPDDEAVSTGGVMMKANSHGHRVVLVTATRGEVGEIYNMDEEASRPRLGEIRTEELKSAAEILGVDRVEFLGYRDSGMVDTADNKDPRSFHQARLDEAAGQLAVFIREERPDVVITYAEDGVYGHPDHIKAHFVTNAALDIVEHEGSPVRKLYYTAIPRSMMEAFVQQMPEEAQRAMSGNMRIAGTPDELITTRVDVHDYVEGKREAFRAHRSQNDPNSWFATMQDQIDRLAGLEHINEGTVIFTAHGVSPQVKERAVQLGLKPVDATCSDVVRTHELVTDLARKGYEVVYIGRKGHPEPEGVVGEAPGKVYLVQEPEDIDALDLKGDRVAVTCQTTLSVWDTEDLIGRVKARYPQAEVHNEICRATQERQEAAVEAAKLVDLVIVVGSPRSSNSLRLVEVVKKLGGKPAYLVDRMEDLNTDWFKGAKKVGVTSGASTPTQLTRRVIEHIEAMEQPA